MDKQEIETLDYMPTSAPRVAKENSTPIIKPETRDKKREVADQPSKKDICGIGDIDYKCPNCGKPKSVYMLMCDDCNKPTEQPNTNVMIIKTIQGLIGVINHNLAKISFNIGNDKLVAKALEEIDLFEKATLFELQKAFE